jgi:hypothetical protein
MADPRNTLSYTDIKPDGASDVGYQIDASTITYDATKTNGSAQVGLAVTLSGNNTIALTADGDFVLGKLESVESDGKARVQELGHMTLPGGDGATLTRGTKIVGALGAAAAKGYIRSAASATAAELLKGRGFIHDVTDTTAVGVALY